MNLRIPGPTPCPPSVLQAMSHEMVDHRGPEFAKVIHDVHSKLPHFFQTSGDVLSLTTAGTGGLEAAIVNFLSPGEKVLSVSIGNFGSRFAKIADTYGAEVVRLKFDPGRWADADQVRDALAKNPDVTTVLITHNETSTGVTNDLETLAKVVKDADKLLVVDAISSMAAIPLPVDAWSCDVVVTGSQKGWMVPPGLAFISVSPRAWDAYKQAKMPRFYFDLGEHKKSLDAGQTPWTPAVSIYFGLEVALDRMQKEGLENIYARHRRCADLTRQGVKDLGLELLVGDERYASNTVTAVRKPEGIEIKALRQALHDEGTVVAGGQGDLSASIFRIGHLGLVSEADIHATLATLRSCLERLGHGAAAAA